MARKMKKKIGSSFRLSDEDHTIMANKNINCSLFGLQGDLNSSLVGYEDATCLLNYSSLARL
jgi:hypothetical protein